MRAQADRKRRHHAHHRGGQKEQDRRGRERTRPRPQVSSGQRGQQARGHHGNWEYQNPGKEDDAREDGRRRPAVGGPTAGDIPHRERTEEGSDQTPPDIDRVAENRGNDAAGDDLQRQQDSAAYKNRDFKNRGSPLTSPESAKSSMSTRSTTRPKSHLASPRAGRPGRPGRPGRLGRPLSGRP